MVERIDHSNYILLPTKFSFPSTVRIYGYILSFIYNAWKGKKMTGELLREAKLWFSVFAADKFSSSNFMIRVTTKTDEEMLGVPPDSGSGEQVVHPDSNPSKLGVLSDSNLLYHFTVNTRSRKVLESKVYVMVSVCVTTKIVNLQILEGRKAQNIMDGFTRLSAEVGVPSVVHVDEESGAMAGLRDADLEYRDL